VYIFTFCGTDTQLVLAVKLLAAYFGESANILFLESAQVICMTRIQIIIYLGCIGCNNLSG